MLGRGVSKGSPLLTISTNTEEIKLKDNFGQENGV